MQLTASRPLQNSSKNNMSTIAPVRQVLAGRRGGRCRGWTFCLTLGFTWMGITIATVQASDLIPDAHLETVLKEVLKQKQIDKPQIEEADLKTIFFLDARGKEIADLTGLEKCINLAEVRLSKNRIQNLKPLSELKNIQSLDLASNQIGDLTPLAGLLKLQYLQLDKNQIAKLEGLEKLENLRTLSLADNQVENLLPLGPLKKLNSLSLDRNQVLDLKPLTELSRLSSLGLKANRVADLTPLTGLHELRFTFLEGNPLNDLGPLVDMAQKDISGEQRFAPYWFLYLDVEPLPATAKPQVEQLQKLGVRINRKP